MTHAFSFLRARLLVALGSVVLLCLAHALPARAQAGSCDQPTSFYEREGYVVTSVRISTGLEWLPSVRQSMMPIVQALPLKERSIGSGGETVNSGAFTAAAYFEGQQIVKDTFPELHVDPNARVAGRISWPSLQDCDRTTRTLSVVYRVYTLGLPTFNALVFEGQPQPLQPGVPDNRTTAFLNRLQIQPALGYNGARKTFGGSSVNAQFGNSIIQNASAQLLGSSQSLTAAAALSGTNDNLQSRFAHMEWKLRYLHNDAPLAQNSTDQNLLTGELLLGTAPVTASELIFRFGGAVEGGNKQTNFAPAELASTDVASSSYGAVKAFLGSSFRLGRHTFKQSYGVKFGGTGAQLDFVKQVADLEQRLRFYPKSHRELTVDTAITLGRIDVFGQLPVAERYFGGSVVQNLTSTDTWVIRNNPLIRSFPESQFVLRGPSGDITGNRFFSTNATLAYNVWRYPLVPAEVENDRDFRANLKTILSASEAVLTSEYISETDDFRKLGERLPAISNLMGQVHDQLKKLDGSGDGAISEALEAATSAAEDVDKKLAKSIQDAKQGALSVADVQALSGLEPEEPGADPDFSLLLDFASSLDDLKSAVSDSGNSNAAADLDRMKQQVRDANASLFSDFVKAMHSESAHQAEDRAKQDMAYSRRVVGEVFDTANLVAVSPVLMFDSSQIWQSNQGGTGIRYGLGTGVKLSLFAVDFTAGYSWNLRRRPGQGGGAFVLGLVVGDLFK